jgi:sugar phosphate isomerase/epimerase
MSAGILLRPSLSRADSLNVPIGLQLYSVREMLPRDFEGTLKQISAIGYREVEAAGFYGHPASDAKKMMSHANLKCVSAHYSLTDLLKSSDAIIEYAQNIGLEWVICSVPSTADAERLSNHPGDRPQDIFPDLTLDDWKWNADQLNQLGRRIKAAGLDFGYHNHTREFRDLDGKTGFNVLLKETDPEYVTLELDCGWAVAAGQDPVQLLTRSPRRFSMLHVKDLKSAPANTAPDKRMSTELGNGCIRYGPIFAAARSAGIRHAFIEQENFDMPAFIALKVDFDNMRSLELAK